MTVKERGIASLFLFAGLPPMIRRHLLHPGKPGRTGWPRRSGPVAVPEDTAL